MTAHMKPASRKQLGRRKYQGKTHFSGAERGSNKESIGGYRLKPTDQRHYFKFRAEDSGDFYKVIHRQEKAGVGEKKP